MSNEQIGIGVKFYRWDMDPTTPAFIEMCNITGLGGPSYARDVLETTDLCTEGGFRTFVGGLRDAGELTVSMNFNKDNFNLMMEDFLIDTPNKYGISIPLPNEMAFEFEGLVQGPPIEIPRDDIITMEVTIKISGKPTIGDAWPIIP